MDDLIGGDEVISREVFGFGFSAVEEFSRMLADQGELRGLIGPREVARLWRRHILNSAALSDFLPESGSVADVGSGAGLPGVVLALMRPDLQFHLIEPMERRVEWLTEVVESLDIDNVSIHQQRAEEVHGKMAFEAVTARAVASLDKLLRLTMPLVEKHGRLLALKGQRIHTEVEAARHVLKKFGANVTAVHEVDVVGDGEMTYVAEVERQ